MNVLEDMITKSWMDLIKHINFLNSREESSVSSVLPFIGQLQSIASYVITSSIESIRTMENDSPVKVSLMNAAAQKIKDH